MWLEFIQRRKGIKEEPENILLHIYMYNPRKKEEQRENHLAPFFFPLTMSQGHINKAL